MEYLKPQSNHRGLARHLRNLLTLVRLWRYRSRSRQQLHDLLLHEPDRLHHDLGLNTEAVVAEISKPFWQD